MWSSRSSSLVLQSNPKNGLSNACSSWRKLAAFFSSCSTMVGTSPSGATYAASNAEFCDSKMILLLNIGGIFSKDMSHWACDEYIKY